MIILEEWVNMIQMPMMKVKNNNQHVHVSDDDGSSINFNGNDNDSNDSQQHGSNSQGDSDSEPKINNSDNNSEPGPDEINQLEDPVSLSKHHNISTQSRLPNVIGGLPNRGNDTRLDGPHWGAMVVPGQEGIRMVKECFEIDASKSTPQYEFRKVLQLFGDEGY